jgi:hypothetical protein
MTAIARNLNIAIWLVGMRALDGLAGIVRKIRPRARNRDRLVRPPVRPDPAALARAALRELDAAIWGA